MKVKLVKYEVFNALLKRLTGHPFYILETIDTAKTGYSKLSVSQYVENNFNSIFNYGINIIRIETSYGGGTALIIADKHSNDGKYGAYIMFGYGYALKCRRCINGNWQDG